MFSITVCDDKILNVFKIELYCYQFCIRATNKWISGEHDTYVNNFCYNETKDEQWSEKKSCQCSYSHKRSSHDNIDEEQPQIISTCSNCHLQPTPNWEIKPAAAINYGADLGIGLSNNHNNGEHIISLHLLLGGAHFSK